MGSRPLRRVRRVTMTSLAPPSRLLGPSSEAVVWRAAMEDKLQALRDLMTSRLDSMDRASIVLADNVNRVPTLLDRETARLTGLFEEKTSHLRDTLKERDNQAHEDKATAATAVSVALNSLKELINSQNTANAIAIGKAEASVSHDLEALNTLISATKDGLNNEINNLKQRLDRGEGMSRGQKELRQEDHMAAGTIVGMVTGTVGVLALIVAVFTYAMPHAAPQVVPTAQPIAQNNPAVGVDTKRVDDLIAQQLDRNRDVTSRMDALSARLNSLTPPQPPAK